jgi:hypothetical protein
VTSTTTLPLTVEDLTPAWFGEALGLRVKTVVIDHVIWGTATKVFVRLTYGTGAPATPPTDLCVKAGFNADLRPMAHTGYPAEAWFYESLAPALDLTLPGCWYAAADPTTQQGVVVLDDLRRSATFIDMLTPLSPDTVAAALDQLARLHGATWAGRGLDAAPWLTLGSPVQRTIIGVMLGDAHWSHHLALPRGAAMPASLRDNARVLAGFEALWGGDDGSVVALSHGDAHCGNLALGADGGPSFVDWQGVCLAPWSDDVAYLIGGALTPDDRRANERDLLAHYLTALAATGAPAPAIDAAWADYRRHHLHGLVWLLVPEAMQPEAVCHAMGERYAIACADHDIFTTLGV